MKNNVITVRNDDGEEIECRVLFTVENENGKQFVVYTQDELDENGNIITYASKIDKNNNLIKVTKEEYNFLYKMLNSLQSEKGSKE